MKKILAFVFLLASLTSKAQNYSLDKQLGEEASKEVEQQFGIYHQKELEETITTIGNKLVAQLSDNPFEYHFSLLNTEIPNAFALPGGYVYVTRGLLVIVQNEDELAGVIGHEIIHVSKRHTVKQMNKTILPSILSIPGNIIGAVAGQGYGDIINTPIQKSSELLLASYSRKHETEADNLGIQLAAKAGYDPSALAGFLERLEKQTELMSGEVESKSFLSTHPYTPSRVTNIKTSSAKLSAGKTFTHDKDSFLLKLEGLLYGPDPNQGIFHDSIFLHVPLDFVWMIPGSWDAINTMQAAGAISKKEDGLVVMTTLPSGKTYNEYADNLKKKIISSSSFKIQSDKDTIFNDIPARMIKATAQANSKETLVIETLLFGFNSTNFQLLSMSTPALQSTVHSSLTSFRKITPDESASVKRQIIQLERAQVGETVSAFSSRTKNLFGLKTTALVNALSENATLSQDQLIKILREESLK